MGRSKQIPKISRPDTSPLLEVELFNPEGNKDGAAVYCEDSELIKFGGKNYKPNGEIPEDYEVTGFLIEDFRGEEILFLNYDKQIKCKLVVVPSDAEKLELSTVFKDFATGMAEETKKMEESFKRTKTLMAGFDPSVESACAGFKFARDRGIEIPTAGSEHFENMEYALENFSKEFGRLAATNPFSNKRKSCD